MKKILTLTIIAMIALIGLSVSVNAAGTGAQADQYLVSSIDELTTALASGGYVKLTADINVGEFTGSKFTVNKDVTVVLDLNGYTISGKNSDENVSTALFSNKGNLTINDSSANNKGKITLDDTKVKLYNWGKGMFAITNGGNLTINAGTIENTGATDVAYAIDNNSTSGNTKLIINGGEIIAGDAVIRAFGNSTTNDNDIIINGGNVSGNWCAIWLQQPSSSPVRNKATLTIKGGTVSAETAYCIYADVFNGPEADAVEININGGVIKNNSAKKPTISFVPVEGDSLENATLNLNITDGTIINITKEGNTILGDTNITNIKKDGINITGGGFSSDVSVYVPKGYVINPTTEYDNGLNMYKVKPNTPHVTSDTITDDSGEVEMRVGLGIQEELERIFEQEIDKNETLRKALKAGESVRINVQVERLKEEDINEEEFKAMKEAAKEGKFVKFYDITLQMIANQTNIGTISEISNKLTFKVLVPEELVKDGRTFFMYRYHDGKVEKLTGELDEENYFTFESDKFSTYVLAYEDKVDEPTTGGQGSAEQQPEKDETPKTGSVDVVLVVSAIVAVVSVAGIAVVKKYTR